MPRMSLGIRAKLITIFILIKVIPLIALAWIAWEGIAKLGQLVEEKTTAMISDTRDVVGSVGKLSTDNSVRALDLKSREALERLTMDTAKAVAAFLSDRDSDILLAAQLDPTPDLYRRFLASRARALLEHNKWVLNEALDKWIPTELQASGPTVQPPVEDDAREFHSRPPDVSGRIESQPLFLEMTFVDLTGRETIKVASSDLLPAELLDVSRKENTWCKAETYFESLKSLQPGEIHVSEVIGSYIGSPLIGPFTPRAAQKKGIPFKPEDAAYAGKENPVGKRFQGLIRWASPVAQQGRITGYVTLALDHRHLMEFTDHIVPTEERYSDIPDASSGNYAFMWDYLDRNIVHPRHYFIVGYDPRTGEMATPWLEDSVYSKFQKSGLSLSEFMSQAPAFEAQSLKKKPAPELTRSGMLGLHCRYLNFAPQCVGWHTLTQYGGSGSFDIFWSGLWKLTTAAAIPYHTGRYAGPKGFGYITIGADVEEFHKASIESASEIAGIVQKFETDLDVQKESTLNVLAAHLRRTTSNLTYYTLAMIVLVILVALWMASVLTRRITRMIHDVHVIESGNLRHCLDEDVQDELGQLSSAFNDMTARLADLYERYRTLVDGVPVGIYRITPEGRILDANQAMVTMLGHQHRDSLLASNLAQTYADPADWDRWKGLMTRDGAVRTFEVLRRRHNGDIFWLAESSRAVENENGQIILYEGCLEDITERKKAEQAIREAEQKYRTIFENAVEGMYQSYPSGGYLSANSALARMLGYDSPEEFMCSIRDVGSQLYVEPGRREELIERMVTHKAITAFHAEMYCKNGSKIWMEISCRPVYDDSGKLLYIEGSCMDITERRRIEEELRTHREHLEKMVEARTKDLEAARTAAEQANNAKSNFLASMSHEIRTPLNIIIGIGELLLESPLTPEQETFVQLLKSSGDSLLDVINEILDISRIEAGRVSLEMIPFDLCAVVRRVCDIMAFKAEGKGIALRRDIADNIPPNLFGDPAKLTQVLMNLVGNAVKFTSEGEVVVTVICDQADENTRLIRVTVRDTGIGIPEASLPTVFESFTQADSSTTRLYGGSGLGLGICRGLIGLMGGKIWAESQEGKGSVFFFEILMKLPLNALESSPALTPTSEHAQRKEPLKGMKILLVEDSKNNQLLIQFYLKGAAHVVDIAENGLAALEKFKSTSYDVIFMDMQMPVMDGFTATRQIREHEQGLNLPPVPIVALTANAFKESRDQCLASGCSAYLSKPISKSVLLETVSKYAAVDSKSMQTMADASS